MGEVMETDPCEGCVRWTALHGSGWRELLDTIGTADIEGGAAEFEGVNADGAVWLFTVADGGSPATDDALTWADPQDAVHEAAMTGGNQKVIDYDNGS